MAPLLLWETHRHKQALVLLDGAHAAQKSNHHDNGAHDDKHIAQREGGEVMEEYSDIVVDQEIYPKAQNAAATELKRRIPQYSKVKHGSWISPHILSYLRLESSSSIGSIKILMTNPAFPMNRENRWPQHLLVISHPAYVRYQGKLTPVGNTVSSCFRSPTPCSLNCLHMAFPYTWTPQPCREEVLFEKFILLGRKLEEPTFKNLLLETHIPSYPTRCDTWFQPDMEKKM